MQGANRGTRSSLSDWRVPMNHASRTVSPEKSKRLKTSVIFGLSALGCYASYDQQSHCLKTCQDFLFPMEDGSSIEFCLTFTDAGMMRNGRVSGLRTSARRIVERGCGLSVIQARGGHYWRTPDANMGRGNLSYETLKRRMAEGKPLDLNKQLNAIAYGLLPTPTASDATTGAIIGKNDLFYTAKNGMLRKINKSGKDGSLGLARFAVLFPTPSAGKTTKSGEIVNADGTPWDGQGKPHSKKTGKPIQSALADVVRYLPTPKARDWKNATAKEWDDPKNTRSLNRLVAKQYEGSDVREQRLGQLNPDWVEALMGYPQGWTDIDIEAPDSADFPAAWLDGSWEAGIPRVASVKKNTRVNRLKGLGNAVVSQIPELLWRLIMEAAG